jgi:hypothetical protein
MVLHEASQFTNGVRFSKSRLRRSFRSDDLSADRLAPSRPRNFSCCQGPRRSGINKTFRKSGSTGTYIHVTATSFLQVQFDSVKRVRKAGGNDAVPEDAQRQVCAEKVRQQGHRI